MKILVFGMSPRGGGVESFIHQYSTNFSEKVIVDYVAVTDKIPFADEFIERGSKIHCVPNRRDGLNAYTKALEKIFVENKYDVVWSNVVSLSSIETLKIAYKYDIKVRIVHSHNSQNMGNGISKILHQFNKLKIKKYATDFWACSTEAGQWMFSNLNINNVKVIKNAIDLQKYQFNHDHRQHIRTSLGLDDDAFVIGNIGRLHFQKNQKFLIDVFREIKKLKSNSKLVIVGSGPEELEIKSYAEKYPNSEDILFLGQRSDVYKMYSAFDVFALPSKFEGLPYVLVESQANGLPSYTSLGKVSKESKLTDLLTFKSLDDTIEDWAKVIASSRINLNSRYDQKEKMELSGFNIKIEAPKVENELRRLIEERE